MLTLFDDLPPQNIKGLFKELPNNCLECGSVIVGKRKDALYCSDTCGNKYRRIRHYRNNPKYYEEIRSRNNSQTKKRILYRVKSRAKKQGIPFDIEECDFEVPSVCPVLGIKIAERQGRKGYHPDSPSLDRIHPEKGYVKGNVRVISARANLLKNNATVEELEAVLEDLKKLWGF